MLYKEFNNIYVENAKEVCSVGTETKLLAKHAFETFPKKAIDLGTGTGFIAIYLASKGVTCTATDISGEAVKLTSINTKKNNLKITIKESDLFSNIEGVFDTIIFSTPLVHIKPRYTKVIRYIRKFFPNGLPIVSNLAFKSQENNRKILLNRLLKEIQNHCHKNSVLVIHIHKKELPIFKEYDLKILANHADFRIVKINSVG